MLFLKKKNVQDQNNAMLAPVRPKRRCFGPCLCKKKKKKIRASRDAVVEDDYVTEEDEGESPKTYLEWSRHAWDALLRLGEVHALRTSLKGHHLDLGEMPTYRLASGLGVPFTTMA